MKDLTALEIKLLQQCLNALESDRENDPKYQKVVDYLFDRGLAGARLHHFFAIL